MHPILFNIPILGYITIHTYGVMVVAGMIAGILWITYESRRLGYDTGKILDLIFYVIVSGVIGSRIFYLMVNDPGRIVKEPWSMFMIWEGGLVFHGGVVFALIVMVIIARKQRFPIASIVDIFAPALAIGHAFGRIGCLMAGCCHGRPAGEAWYSIVFPNDPASFAPPGIGLYPTQIIESIGEVIIFVILVLFRKYKRFEGQVFALYLMIYSILRFLNELLRGESDRGYIIKDSLSVGQGMSIALFIIGILIMVFGYSRKKEGR